MTAKLDAPAWILDWFRLDVGPDRRLQLPLRWATPQQLRDEPPRQRRKRIPFGELVGGRPVHGRGALVMCSGRVLLSSDIEAACFDGGRWPWDGGPEVAGKPGPNDDAAVATIHTTWALNDDGEIVWAREPHFTKPVGSLVAGTALAGRNDRVIFTAGTYYLASDVRHVLEHGRFPWQHDWN